MLLALSFLEYDPKKVPRRELVFQLFDCFLFVVVVFGGGGGVFLSGDSFSKTERRFVWCGLSCLDVVVDCFILDVKDGNWLFGNACFCVQRVGEVFLDSLILITVPD